MAPWHLVPAYTNAYLQTSGETGYPRAMAEGMLFETSSDELLISVYRKQGRTLDDLPYTPQFEAIFEAVVAGDDDSSDTGGRRRHQLFRHLHNLRKAGKLPRLGRAAEGPPHIDAEHEALLDQLVEARLGRLSLRDQLPYTEQFDEVVNTFNAQAGLSLSPHDVWRIIAKRAK